MLKSIHIGTYGQTFVFDAPEGTVLIGVAKAISTQLFNLKFTGLCEHYSGNLFWGTGPYAAGLLLRFEKGNKNPDYTFWEVFREELKVQLSGTSVRMEATEKRAMEGTLLFQGTFRLKNGLLVEASNDVKEVSFYGALMDTKSDIL